MPPNRSFTGLLNERIRKSTIYPLSKTIESYCREHQIHSTSHLLRTLAMSGPYLPASDRERRITRHTLEDVVRASRLAIDRITGNQTRRQAA